MTFIKYVEKSNNMNSGSVFFPVMYFSEPLFNVCMSVCLSVNRERPNP